MPFHDPRREIEKLRDHLASHDKPLGLLIGAGASSAVRDPAGEPLIPAIAPLGALCEEAVAIRGVEHAAGYATIKAQLEGALGREPTIEDILSDVRGKIGAMAGADTLAGVDRTQLEAVETTIRETIAAAARPDEARIPAALPHHALARWAGRIDRRVPVEIFTTNYDTLLERALETERVPVFDGFVGSRQPFFLPASLQHPAAAPARRWARLWKIHGSVNWYRVDEGTTFRIVRGAEHGGGELIYPSLHKYDESRKQPYAAILDHLSAVLNRPEEMVMLTIGYSFGDEHINAALFEALDVRERAHVISLQYVELPSDHTLIRRAAQRHNLIVYGPETAVVGGVRAPWRLVDPVDNRTADLLDIPFDSDAEPDPDAAALTGRFRLGDFAWLGRFLDSVVGRDG